MPASLMDIGREKRNGIMNAYKFFKHGRSYRKNARFGTHVFIGAHRYIYYMDGRSYYFYSDRPYTINDAKTWKIRNLIRYVVLSVVCMSLLFDKPVNNLSESVNFLLNVVILCATVSCFFRTIIFLLIDPKKDPMLQSSQCNEN